MPMPLQEKTMPGKYLRHGCLAAAFALAASGAAGASALCSAMSGVVVPTVVELYTSEGCSSCPPADRWLASLEGRPDVVRLAFHVDYWDRLGWKDRFADPAYTQRQHEASRRAGARFVYTPQVIVDGADWRAWPGLPTRMSRLAAVQIALSGTEDGAFVARIVRGPGAPIRLAAFWAVTEDGHVSQVKAGENSGATLRHEAVVRELLALDTVGDAPLHFEPRTRAEAGVPRHVQIVVVDAVSGKPVQAVRC